MYKILYPEKDATIYESAPDKNTGIDQILEIRKFAVGEPHDDVTDQAASWDRNYNSRILLKFNINDLNIPTNATASAQYYLTLRAAEAIALPTEYTIEAKPLSEDWVNGNGNYNDSPEITNGVSWLYKTSKQEADNWTGSEGSQFYTSVTGGGTWNDLYYGTQSFTLDLPDINMNVTPIVNKWISGDIPNYGFILKHTNSNEQNTNIFGTLAFFGRETHTIYLPTLKVFYPDATTYTGSYLSTTNIDEDYIIYLKNLRGEYDVSEIAKIRLGVRDQFMTRTYATTQSSNDRLLPSTTYFSVQDSVTEIDVIPFNDVGTKLQTDDSGHYIKLDFSSFLPNRYYKIVFKVVDDNGTRIIDNDYNFKVGR